MAEIASAFVSLMPSARGFGKKLNSEISGDVKSSGKKLGAGFGKVFAAAGGAIAAVGVGNFIKGAITGAGDLEQSVGAIDTIFGKSAGKMHEWSKGAAQSVGLTRNEFNELGTLIGSQLKNGGTAMDQLAPKTRELVTAGADLSAMFGGSTKDAVAALSSALKGERDPIERYGVSLNQAKIDAEAAALGFAKVGGALSDEAKQAATLSLISKQTADAHGTFAKESTTLAGQQQRLSASWGNMKTQLGTALLPAITAIVTNMNAGLGPAVERIKAGFSTFVTYLAPTVVQLKGFFAEFRAGTGVGGQFASVLGTIGAALSTLGSFIVNNKAAVGTFVGIVGTAVAISRAWIAVQTALNVVMALNPIMLVVIAVAALAAGAVIAYKRSATFRGVIDKLWGALKVAGKWVGDIAKRVVDFAGKVASVAFPIVRAYVSFMAGVYVGAFKVAIAIVGAIIRKVIEFGGALVGGVQAAARFVGGVKEKVGAALNFVQSIPGKVKAVFTGAATMLYNAGVQLMTGLASGIKGKITDAINEVKAGLSKIKGLLPGSPIKWGPLKNWNKGGAGKRLMNLVARGIKEATPKTVKAAQDAFEKIGDKLKSQRDNIKSTLEGLKGDFASLADSVSSAFTGNLFDVSAIEADAAAGTAGKTVGQSFIDNLMGKKGQLEGLMASFKTLKGWGLDPSFLSQLFASGNGALITELAAMGKEGALGAATLFGEVTSLGDQLGNAVAKNDPVTDEIKETNRQLNRVNRQLSFLAKEIGKELNGAAAQARRKSKSSKDKKDKK